MIEGAKKLARKYLDETTYLHSMRVAQFTEENEMIPGSLKERCIALAWLHDVWEDSDCTKEEVEKLDKQLRKYMEYITHRMQEQTYEEYIRSIKKVQALYPEVWWVKLADMKDHFSQKETLTKRLKDKYTSALAILL